MNSQPVTPYDPKVRMRDDMLLSADCYLPSVPCYSPTAGQNFQLQLPAF